ncbi:MAG: YihA family ribosome biogenesis GTP-binding protein [Myxococcales bacterium]|nr:YihA family ribosome biogenesis GTP-binding protein [Myxococcales bacterium]
MPENPHVHTARFITSAVAPGGYPETGLPEIAIAGRSNVGKSSLLNTFVNQRRLAKVSGTPGRTQLLNFFDINGQFVVCDLPGYGYAKVPPSVKAAWGPMVERYLSGRPPLKGLLLLVDCRRTPGEWERDLVGFATANGLQVGLVATKIDKLPKSKQVPVLAELARRFGVARHQVVAFSSLTGEGIEPLWRRIQRMLPSPPEGGA